MSCPVESHFGRQSLCASSEWIAACKEWCQSQQTATPQSTKGLVEACQEQWLDTDIRGDGVQK